MCYALRTLLLCSLIFAHALAGITLVDDSLVWVYPGSVLSEKSSVYALKDTPIGIETPAISFQLTLQQIPADGSVNNSSPLIAEVAIFHSSRWYEIGLREGLHNELCCTPKLYDQGSCRELGRLALLLSPDPTQNGNTLYRFQMAVPTDLSPATFTQSVVPENSGVWYVYFVNCDPQKRTYTFTGSVTYKSPYGFIPANSFPNMVVYFTVGGLFFILLSFWLVWMVRFRVNVQFYQHGITILMILSLAEEIFWGWEYVNYNNTGLPTLAVLVPAAILTSLKVCWVRVLLLLMGLGFRIITPFLTAGLSIGIVFMTIFYFAVSVAQAYLEVDDLFGFALIAEASWVNTAFMVILNIVFILWTLGSTIRSMTTCQNEKQNNKYQMYKRNLIIFGSICAASVIFFFAQIAITVSYVADASWRSWWLLRTYWDFIYLAFTCFIAYIWRPAADNNRFAYSALQDDTGITIPEVRRPANNKSKSKKNKGKVSKKAKSVRVAEPKEVTLDDSSSSSSD